MGCCSSQRHTERKKTYFTTNIRTFYRFGAVLGKGSFGIVKVGYKDGPYGEKVYAIKTINKVRVADKTQMIQEEFEILRKMDHPNIVRFYEMYEDDMFIYFVMEHCKGGNLLERVLSKGSFDETKASIVMRKLFSAISYLHSQGVMHRDLKPENILLSNENDDAEIKIIDFGLSKKLKESDKDKKKQLQRKQSQVGTPLYVAPEVLTGVYNQKCDDWAVGCIMYIVLCSEPPFFSEHLKELLQKIQYKPLTFPQEEWKGISQECKKIVQGLLQKDPEKRMTSFEALNSVWAKKAFRKPLQIKINQKQGNIVQSNDCTPVNTSNIKGLKRYAKSKQFKREVLRILINQLNDKQIDKLSQKFKELDKDEDGFITPQELSQIMTKLGFETTKNEIEQLIQNMNPEEQQALQIKYTQFLAATLDLKQHLNKERLWSLFRYFDVQDKKYITKEDIQQAFKREGRDEMASDKILTDIMIHDGKMTYKDFCQLMHDDMESDQFFEYFEKLHASPENHRCISKT
ncbi:unnamed protein product [Paramecium sonneborni]|uniref:Protein kinase domain containing protein n=1 Tax=Paramecium sonneborni TaxID=65129 RepID=A0A8S1RH33_9CILI|nr:unnamed protein product [Paramecium sonneborni]